jgi:phage terminase small subunit
MALTAKQESFCLAYVETGNASEAYRRAYNAENMKPATINRTAKDVLDNPNIAARLKELRAPAVAKAQLTIEDLLRELEEARKIALECPTPQTGAAVNATLGKAKLLGLDKQIVELTGKGGGAIITRVERVIIDAPKD